MMRGRHAVERAVHYGSMTVLGGGRGGHSKHVRLIAVIVDVVHGSIGRWHGIPVLHGVAPLLLLMLLLLILLLLLLLLLLILLLLHHSHSVAVGSIPR